MVMAALVIIGMITTLFASEPNKSAQAEAVRHDEPMLPRLTRTIVGAFTDFLRDGFRSRLSSSRLWCCSN